MSEGMNAERNYMDFSVGIVEIKFRDKYPHLGELLMDFSKHGEGGGLADDAGDGRYYIVLPGTLGEMKKDSAIVHIKATSYAVFHLKGGTVDVRTPVTDQDFQRWINAAKAAREEFVQYLEKEKIPHKVLITLFDD